MRRFCRQVLQRMPARVFEIDVDFLPEWYISGVARGVYSHHVRGIPLAGPHPAQHGQHGGHADARRQQQQPGSGDQPGTREGREVASNAHQAHGGAALDGVVQPVQGKDRDMREGRSPGAQRTNCRRTKRVQYRSVDCSIVGAKPACFNRTCSALCSHPLIYDG